MVTVTRSAGGLERAMDGKRYADQYDHTDFPMARPALVRQQRKGMVLELNLRLDRTIKLLHEVVEHRPPLENLAELRMIALEILQRVEELEGVLR